MVANRIAELERQMADLKRLWPPRSVPSSMLQQLECIGFSGNGGILLPAGSVDVVLLYDVLHHRHFPQCHERISRGRPRCPCPMSGYSGGSWVKNDQAKVGAWWADSVVEFMPFENLDPNPEPREEGIVLQ